jgi:energy-coupling factor transporter ATP-binding protein EcfA2
LLDKTIGGGLRPGELLLIGGAQGTGKTTMALQMARNVASSGQANVLYICFEHEEQYLLNRLVALESALAHLPQKTGAIKIQDVRKEIMSSWMGEGHRRSRPDGQPEAAAEPGPNRPLRPEPVPDARLADGQHDPQHSQAGPAASDPFRRSAPAGGRGLHAEGPDVPRAEHRGGEGHVHRQRPQGHRPVGTGADDLASWPPTRKA